MITQNHIHILKNYAENEKKIQSLIDSMMTSLDTITLLNDREQQKKIIENLCLSYPFVELIYSLNSNGIQIMDSVYSPTISNRKKRSYGKGSDRRNRPYVIVAREQFNRVIVTQPYLSNATHQLSISGVQHIINDDGVDLGYLVLNFNLQKLIIYLNGDGIRYYFHPWFQAVYCVIGLMLIIVSGLLIYSSIESMLKVFKDENHIATSAFGIVIIITLGMSIFDLGKTILEEEVLVNKDIHHHDTTRRTISRFMAAIIIAVSIEALLLMFKSLLYGNNASVQLINAVWMLLSAVAMMIGLGLYLWLTKESKN